MSPGECIIHDNGGEFNNGFLKKLAKEMNVDLRMTTGGRPWANGQAEAAVKLLKNKIKMIALDTTESNSIFFLEGTENKKYYYHFEAQIFQKNGMVSFFRMLYKCCVVSLLEQLDLHQQSL